MIAGVIAVGWGSAIAGALVGSLVTGGIALHIHNREVDEARPGSVEIQRYTAVAGSGASLEHMPRVTKVEGIATIPQDAVKRDLWIVVEVGVNATYYPQGHASVNSDGTWECLISFGSTEKSDDGTYTVIAYLADPTASEQFGEFVSGDLAKGGKAMTQPPSSEDADPRSSFAVFRDESVPSAETRLHPERGCAD